MRSGACWKSDRAKLRTNFPSMVSSASPLFSCVTSCLSSCMALRSYPCAPYDTSNGGRGPSGAVFFFFGCLPALNHSLKDAWLLKGRSWENSSEDAVLAEHGQNMMADQRVLCATLLSWWWCRRCGRALCYHTDQRVLCDAPFVVVVQAVWSCP